MPVGAALEGWRARPRPPHETLRGTRAELVPLDPAVHGDDLYAAGHEEAGDAPLWRYLAVGPFERAAFSTWLAECVASDGLFYVVVADGRAQGMCAYLGIAPAHGSIEIGSIWFGPRLRRTPAATEAIFLLARHVFDDLGYRRLEWKCDARNERSMRAAERFGFIREGVFRQHQVVKGRNRDTAWWSILDSEWPRVRSGFEAWLTPENFDADGVQRATLRELRGDR